MSKIVQTVKVGRFTVVEIQTPEGTKAVGISRRAQGDNENDKKGQEIALGRAIKASVLKQKGKTVRHQYMG